MPSVDSAAELKDLQQPLVRDGVAPPSLAVLVSLREIAASPHADTVPPASTTMELLEYFAQMPAPAPASTLPLTVTVFPPGVVPAAAVSLRRMPSVPPETFPFTSTVTV